MHLIYMDDSRDEQLCVFSALVVPEDRWQDAFAQVRQFRRDLKNTDTIYVYTELHAWKFVSGRGRISDRAVPKGRRCQIFKEALQMIAGLPEVRLFNAVFPAKQDERAFERLLNGIQLVDFCAYALLRGERPIPSKTKYGLNQAFQLLNPILVLEASTRDPEGIIRP